MVEAEIAVRQKRTGAAGRLTYIDCGREFLTAGYVAAQHERERKAAVGLLGGHGGFAPTEEEVRLQ